MTRRKLSQSKASSAKSLRSENGGGVKTDQDECIVVALGPRKRKMAVGNSVKKSLREKNDL